MVLSFKTEALNGLCSEDQLELLDAVDQLRLQGIDHYISLPQIIVCGDQSSGKSSVLEAISGVPFPVKSDLCTRCPTEVILRRSQHSDVTVSIIPHKSFDAEGGDEDPAPAFSETLDSFEGLSDLIESAQMAMGISMQGKSFSNDLLRIEISGPHHPHLTIVDLPGLIHSATKQQTAEDIKIVQGVVKSYMMQPRSIILAVVSAKNDIGNQIVLELVHACDPEGKRTIGVITKPDTLVPGSMSESKFVSLAENKEFELNLGWHVLKNLDSETVAGSSLLKLRNDEEEKFFSEGIWQTLPSSMLGVKQIRKRLSEVLLKQIATELPSLIREIDNKLEECNSHLKDLGVPRVTLNEQKGCLLQISQRFQSLVSHAVNGTYVDPFFDSANTDRGYNQRLRAVIENLSRDFSQKMATSGHKTTITANESFDLQGHMSRNEYVSKAQELIRRTQGRELPGRFNSMIVSDLFLEQCQPWRSIILDHLRRSWLAARTSVTIITKSISEDTIIMPLIHRLIHPALERIYDDMMCKAKELIDSHLTCHPLTYNKQYLERVHQIGDQRRRDVFKAVLQNVLGPDTASVHLNGYYNIQSLLDQLSKQNELDDERFAASEAVDCMEAYYSVALMRIIDEIALEIVEKKLMAVLCDVLSPMTVLNMSEQDIVVIAGESQESRDTRAKLAKQVEVLTKGSETCKRFAGVRLGG
ncbi:dynamin family protein [Xylariaceae sp. FL0255]|nr:dynamin family protein [Xylariaceae sp. FL0255]